MNDNSQNKRPTEEELRERLSEIEFQVTQCDATEPPFNNKYWDNHEEGIYVDVVTGVPLFSSTDKYDSGTGWPSFTRPIRESVLAMNEDATLGMIRTEVRSADGDSHIGHVFNDGPKDKGGLRFCTNSASLKFIPKAEMEEKGYGEYLKLFLK
jgi:methionine-R-sulfoxide reductase